MNGIDFASSFSKKKFQRISFKNIPIAIGLSDTEKYQLGREFSTLKLYL